MLRSCSLLQDKPPGGVSVSVGGATRDPTGNVSKSVLVCLPALPLWRPCSLCYFPPRLPTHPSSPSPPLPFPPHSATSSSPPLLPRSPDPLPPLPPVPALTSGCPGRCGCSPGPGPSLGSAGRWTASSRPAPAAACAAATRSRLAARHPLQSTGLAAAHIKRPMTRRQPEHRQKLGPTDVERKEMSTLEGAKVFVPGAFCRLSFK